MEQKIGTITHYYGKIGVAIIKLSGTLKVGDAIHVVGHSADFTQNVTSLQLEHKAIESAKKGEEVGLKLDKKVHEGEEVFLVK